MSYFLAVAYFEGATVPADQKQALAWFEKAASAGNRRAQSWLAGPR
jgi:TPR repeat protein